VVDRHIRNLRAWRIALFVSAIVLVVYVSAVGARGDQGDPQGRVDISFTKWVLNGGAGPFMAGFTGGDVEGAFAGEVFENVPSKRVPSLVSRLEVIGPCASWARSRSTTEPGPGQPRGFFAARRLAVQLPPMRPPKSILPLMDSLPPTLSIAPE
jgi:hypothetical protein